MKGLTAVLALPASLLSLVASSTVHALEQPWPNTNPRDVKHYPELEELMRKDAEAKEKLAWQRPIGMKKMSGDDGEKFFLHYWDFGETSGSSMTGANSSTLLPLLAPIGPHSRHDDFGLRVFGRSLLARDYKCPSNTHACSGSDLCCKTGETCVSTNNGTGCCPAGETCGETVGACTDGYTSCPNSSNGGCCIPGAVCKGTGCIIYGTKTVTTTLPTRTTTDGVSSPSSSSASSTPSVRTVTETVVLSGSGFTTTKTVTVTDGSSSSSSSTDAATTTTSTTTATASQPIRKTSFQPSSSTTASTTTTTTANSNCPPNYYQCSAHYIGCCKVERDCDVLSCPATDSTILSTSGVTIVESGPTAGVSTCMGGWFSCPAAESGGCCPTGYTCGTASCMETRNGIIKDTPKQTPSSASTTTLAWGFVAIALVAGIGMVAL